MLISLCVQRTTLAAFVFSSFSLTISFYVCLSSCGVKFRKTGCKNRVQGNSNIASTIRDYSLNNEERKKESRGTARHCSCF